MTDAAVAEPDAGWRERVTAAAESKVGPAPSTEHLQVFFDVLDGLEEYVVAAATQWCIEHGDGAVRWCPEGSHPECPAERYGVSEIDWDQTHADTITVRVYRSHGDYREGRSETLSIPIGDLLPEFGKVRSLVKALSS